MSGGDGGGGRSLCAALWDDNKACALCLGEGGEPLNRSFPESQAAAFRGRTETLCFELDPVRQNRESAKCRVQRPACQSTLGAASGARRRALAPRLRFPLASDGASWLLLAPPGWISESSPL